MQNVIKICCANNNCKVCKNNRANKAAPTEPTDCDTMSAYNGLIATLCAIGSMHVTILCFTAAGTVSWVYGSSLISL